MTEGKGKDAIMVGAAAVGVFMENTYDALDSLSELSDDALNEMCRVSNELHAATHAEKLFREISAAVRDDRL